MKRSLTAVAVALAGLAACTADYTNSIVIEQNQSVDRQTTMCVLTTTPTMQARTIGLLDVGLVEAGYDGYYIFPLVKNELAESTNTAQGARNSVALKGANVELVPDASLATVLPDNQRQFFASSFGGTIDPGQAAPMQIDAIPRQAALAMAPVVKTNLTDYPTVTARLQAVGDTTGNTVTSAWNDFPVRLCRFCLTGGTPPACMPYKPTDVKLGGCLAEMDLPVTCCTNQQGQILCGPDVPMSQ